jgi:integrase
LQEHERSRASVRAAESQAPTLPALTKRDDKTGPNTAATKPEEWRLPKPTDLLFPKWQRELFKTILEEENLRTDRDGRPRTAYSLRHTYICLRLMEGADIYQIAKNCRTSVEMIEKYYAAHSRHNLMPPRSTS